MLRCLDKMPREEIKIYQEKKLRAMVGWVYQRSKFWNDKFKEAKIHPSDIKTIEDFKKVPFGSKEEHQKAINVDAPYGGLLCHSIEELMKRGAFIWRTSGTTGRPRQFICSMKEYESYMLRAYSKVWLMAGCEPGYVAMIPFPLLFWLAGWGLRDSAVKAGLTVLPVGPPMDTKMRLKTMQEYRPDVIVVTPSYALHMAEIGGKEGIPIEKLGLKRLIVSGEPCPNSTRKRLEETWGLQGGVRDFYGISEIGPTAIDCRDQVGMHCFEDIQLFEVLESDGTESVAPGEDGELVLTCLEQRDIAAGFHFRTGDIVRCEDEKCSCGKTTRRIRIMSRKDDMLKIRGINVFPSAIEDLVRKHPELSNEYQLILEKVEELDRVTLRVETLPPVPKSKHPELKNSLEDSIRSLLLLRIPVEIVKFGVLPRFELKAKRLIDKREPAAVT